MSIHAQLGRPTRHGFAAEYLDALSLVERLHRLLLDVIKDEFERVGVIEINAVQALLLFNIGENEVTAGELRTRAKRMRDIADLAALDQCLQELDQAGFIQTLPGGRATRHKQTLCPELHPDGPEGDAAPVSRSPQGAASMTPAATAPCSQANTPRWYRLVQLSEIGKE